jgi:hypothetical protein
MAARSPRESFGPLQPDYENKNPYRGLPADFPPSHSRFPIVPSAGYGSLSFLPSTGQNGDMEGTKRALTSDDRSAWQEVMRETLGDAAPAQPAVPGSHGD